MMTKMRNENFQQWKQDSPACAPINPDRFADAAN